MTTNTNILIPCLLLLSGCATVHRLYVPPTDENAAHLRVVDPNGRGLPASVHISTFEKPENCERRWFLQGVASQLKQTAVTLSYMKIEAGRSFALAVNVPMGGDFISGFRYCAPVTSFVPEAGRFYTATVGVNPENRDCYLAISSATAPSMAQSRVEPIKKLIFSNGFDENSSFCKPD